MPSPLLLALAVVVPLAYRTLARRAHWRPPDWLERLSTRNRLRYLIEDPTEPWRGLEPPGGRWLEVGPGAGFHTEALARLAAALRALAATGGLVVLGEVGTDPGYLPPSRLAGEAEAAGYPPAVPVGRWWRYQLRYRIPEAP